MSPPPTNIDGTDITGATIDGQDVEEITIDGQTVFTADAQPESAVAYYDPRQESSTGNINTISDLENGFDLTGSASIISNGLGGLQSYRLDGNQTMNIVSSSMASTEEFAVLTAAIQQAEQNSGDNRYIFSGGSFNDFTINDDNGVDWAIFRGGSLGAFGSGAIPPNANPHIFELVASNTDQVELLIDGISILSGTAAATDLNGLSLASQPDGVGQTQVDFGEIVVLEGTNATERQTERQRLANNWGISL